MRGFGQSLQEKGYCKASVDGHLAGVRKLDRWLAERKLGLEDLGGITAQEFVQVGRFDAAARAARRVPGRRWS
jgi:hypothetical protein